MPETIIDAAQQAAQERAGFAEAFFDPSDSLGRRRGMSDKSIRNLEKLIAAKAKGKEIKAAPEPQAPKVIDIMDALRQSLEQKKPVKRSKTAAQSPVPRAQ